MSKHPGSGWGRPIWFPRFTVESFPRHYFRFRGAMARNEIHSALSHLRWGTSYEPVGWWAKRKRRVRLFVYGILAACAILTLPYPSRREQA